MSNPASFFLCHLENMIKMSQPITPCIESVLQMLRESGNKAAVVVGFLPSKNDMQSSVYDNAVSEFEESVKVLVRSGIRTFFFISWGGSTRRWSGP